MFGLRISEVDIRNEPIFLMESDFKRIKYNLLIIKSNPTCEDKVNLL